MIVYASNGKLVVFVVDAVSNFVLLIIFCSDGPEGRFADIDMFNEDDDSGIRRTFGRLPIAIARLLDLLEKIVIIRYESSISEIHLFTFFLLVIIVKLARFEIRNRVTGVKSK